MTRRIIAMMLTLCMAVSLLGGTVSAQTLRDDLSGVQLQKNVNEKWTDQELIRMTEQLPGAVAVPADVGDHEIEESEPNNSYSTANPVANDYTVYGAIEGDDVDGFVFTLDTYSEVTIVSICSTGGLLYGILDAQTQDVVAESGYLGQDEDTGLFMDGLDVELPAGDYCVVFGDYYEEYLEYMFYIQIVEVTAHEHRYDVTVVEPTCTEGGYSIYTCACGDSYMDDETAALGHSFENSPVIPHEDGKHHCWDCIRCDERRTENCTFTGTVTKEPTEEAAGVKTFTCGVCGNSYTESIPKLDHEHSYTSKVVAPTCTEGGYTEYTCACGHSYKANETAALGHDFEKSAVNPGKDGKHHYWTCSRCDEVKTESCTFTGTVTKEPTVKEDGIKTYTCGICGNSYTETIEGGIPRIYGDNRVETSFEVADALKEVLGITKFDSILIANGNNFADALAGAYLASQKNAPILLYRAGFETEILTYIRNNMTSGGTIYILGGTAAVPQVMEDTLSGLKVKRLYGSNRFETNMEILKAAGVTGEEILIATGYEYADCLSASATGLPVLLVNTNNGKLTDSQIAFLEAHADNTYTIIGGTGAVSEDLKEAIEDVIGREVCRVFGNSREETSVKVAETYFDAPDYVLLAFSRGFPDGLCGGPLAHAMNAPLLLINAGKEADAAAYVKDNGVTSGAILGGTAVVSEASGRIVFGLK